MGSVGAAAGDDSGAGLSLASAGAVFSAGGAATCARTSPLVIRPPRPVPAIAALTLFGSMRMRVRRKIVAETATMTTLAATPSRRSAGRGIDLRFLLRDERF